MCKYFPCRGDGEIPEGTVPVCPSSSSSSAPAPAHYSQHWNAASRGWMCTAAASGPPVAFPSPSGCASLLWSQPGVPAVGCGTLLPLALLGSRARKVLDQAVPWAMCSEGWVGVGLPGSCSVQTSQQQHCWVTFCLFLPKKNHFTRLFLRLEGILARG